MASSRLAPQDPSYSRLTKDGVRVLDASTAPQDMEPRNHAAYTLPVGEP